VQSFLIQRRQLTPAMRLGVGLREGHPLASSTPQINYHYLEQLCVFSLYITEAKLCKPETFLEKEMAGFNGVRHDLAQLVDDLDQVSVCFCMCMCLCVVHMYACVCVCVYRCLHVC
jgi:hypothetical protein